MMNCDQNEMMLLNTLFINYYIVFQTRTSYQNPSLNSKLSCLILKDIYIYI